MAGIAKRRAEALAIHREGRLGEAERRYRSILADAANDGETWHYLAVLCGQSERHGEAAESCERALAAGYRGAAVLANLANALAALGRPRDSAAALARAVAADPSNPDLVLDLAEVRESLGDERGALAALNDAFERFGDDPAIPAIAASLGQLAVRVNRGATALAAFHKAAELAPRSAEHQTNLGSVLQMQGRRRAAEAAYLRALELDPDLVPCYWYLAELRCIDTDEPLGRQILALAAKADAAPPLRFAGARILAAAGDTEAAFRHYAAGNADVRAGYAYSVERAAGDMAALGDRTLSDAGQATPVPVASSGPVPVFIVGMPRAGSTLIEQMLGRHPAIAAGGENPWLQRLVRNALDARGLAFPGDQDRLDDDELAAIRDAYLESLTMRGGDAPFVTDKLPANFLCLPVVRRLFPQALVVHARRDALETCWSCYKQLFAAPQDFAYDLRELGRYYRSSTAFIERCRRLSDRVVELTLDRLLAAPRRELSGILGRLGLGWDPACLEPERTPGLVATASALQIREGLYSRPRRDAAVWLPYLAPLTESLGDSAVVD